MQFCTIDGSLTATGEFVLFFPFGSKAQNHFTQVLISSFMSLNPFLLSEQLA